MHQQRRPRRAVGDAAPKARRDEREIAAVVEAGEPVREGKRQALLIILLQPVLQALAAHLRAHARHDLVAVQRPQQIVGGAEVEPFGDARQLLGIGDQQDRHEPAHLLRAQLADDAQRIDLAGRVEDDEIDRPVALRRQILGRAGRGPARSPRATAYRRSASPRRRFPPTAGCARDRISSAARLSSMRALKRPYTSSRWRHSSIMRRSRTSERTRAKSAMSLTGLVRKSSAPASSPRTRSDVSDSAVTITTGMSAVASSAFRRRHTSKPSSFGIMTSSRMRSGRSSGRDLQGGIAVVRGQHVEVFGRELGLEQTHVHFDVVDDEDAGRHGGPS